MSYRVLFLIFISVYKRYDLRPGTGLAGGKAAVLPGGDAFFRCPEDRFVGIAVFIFYILEFGYHTFGVGLARQSPEHGYDLFAGAGLVRGKFSAGSCDYAVFRAPHDGLV